ncbi:MAG: phosphatidylglycerol lysyltransferase domain-containing protein [Oscillospiraceae bacterium]|jgi:hypothetical protein|nr:phosphatidylglycerol lysyltransferase domain-containing protein [Oscillospiraceae bacterium]
MLDFQPMTLADAAWMKPLQESSHQICCEYLPGNIYLWGTQYGTEICRLKGRRGDFFLTYSHIEHNYGFPTGTGDVSWALSVLFADAEARDIPPRLFGVSDRARAVLEGLYPGRFAFLENRDFSDYVYNASDLIHLPGKKYHAKRNHIAALVKAHEWHYAPLTRENVPDCRAFQAEWLRANAGKNPEELAQEDIAVQRALAHFDALGFVGGVLYVGDAVAGFTVGERVNESIFCTHIEKADGAIRGAYPLLNREFAANALADYEYIDREEDTGDPGLRRAKLSYYPVRIPVEYTMVEMDSIRGANI